MGVSSAAVGPLVVNIVMPILATIGVGLRLLARRMKIQKLSSDDYVIIITLICTLAVCANGIYASTTGLFGVHFENMTFATYMRFRKVIFADEIIVNFVLGLVKISVLLFYKRIFITSSFHMRANIMIAIVSGYTITCFFGFLFSSKGVSSFWTTPPQLDLSEYVINLNDFQQVIAAFDITLDVIILSLPIPVIKSLHMATTKKISLIAVFLLGAFCVICSCVRLYYIHALLSFGGSDSARRTYLSDSNDLWGHIEACASVLAACLPTLGPLYGSRTPGSLVGSVRSIFSIRTNYSIFSVNRRSEPRNNSQDGGETASGSSVKREWIELNGGGGKSVVERTIESGDREGKEDLEAGKVRREGNAKGIVIERSFTHVEGSAV